MELSRIQSDNLRCADCKNYLNVLPIMYHVTTGNAICGRCYDINNASQYIHNTNYEFLLTDNILFPCRYTENGCKILSNASATDKHEKNCIHRPITCPYEDCTEMVIVNNISQHFQEGHAQYIHQTENDLLLNWDDDFNCYILVTDNTRKYIFHCIYIKEDNKFKCIMYMLTNIYDTNYYTLEFSKSNSKQTVSYKNECILISQEGNYNKTSNIEIDLNYINDVMRTNDYKIKISIINTISTNWSSDFILNDLECPVCKEYYVEYIYLCRNGHNFCNQCKIRLDICPICRADVSDCIRNYTLEKIVEKMKFPCKYKCNGCMLIFDNVNLRNHETNCCFKDI